MRIKSWLSANRILAPLVWTYHPYMLETARSIKPAKLIYHCADYLGAVPGIDQASFDAMERELLARADVTFAASHRLQERCSAIAGARSHYFGNVADVSHFATARSVQALPPEFQSIPRPRLGYVGALSDFKVDFDLLCAMVDQQPAWQLVLIGDEREGQADQRLADLVRHPNVHLLGWRPYQDLPRYMAGLDVGLLPLLINNYTQAMFPMKFFEYVAAGLPIVSTPLDAIREYTSLYSVASDAAAFTTAVRSILSSRPSQLALDNPILLQNSWDERLDRMLAVIEAGELR